MLKELKPSVILELSKILPSKIILLAHDKEGNILEFFHLKSPEYGEAIHQLEAVRKLTPYFDLSELPGLHESTAYGERPDSPLDLPSFRFFTSLSRCSLVSTRLEENYFLARFSVVEFQPMLVSHSLHTYALFDMEKDLLVGFTPEFHSLFAKRFPKPAQLLNMPAAELFSPTPAGFQRGMIPKLTSLSETDSQLVYDRDFTIPSTEVKEESLPSPSTYGPAGLFWENNKFTQTYFTVLEPLEMPSTDFTLSLSFQPIRGSFPYFVLGQRYKGDTDLPDSQGYMAGWLANPGQVAVKRNGYGVFLTQRDLPRNKETILVFRKTGFCIEFFENGSRIASFYDSDFLCQGKNFVSMALRYGDACLIRRLSLRVRRRERGTGEIRPVRYVIKLNGQEDRYFTMDRFYNQALSQIHLLKIAGFFLSDITEMKEQIQELTGKYQEQVRREKELKRLLSHSSATALPFIGESKPISVIRNIAVYAASSNATVLVEGPTGSGKEVLARFIHEQSERRAGPFVKVDCATIPPSLIEARLFGHEKGAFTGAHARAIGLFETADKGTIFLDEVGNLTREVQAKLLQFLNDFTITRIGGSTPRKLDVRLIAASNVNLQALVQKGTFREDLYYRLHVVFMTMPPLKEHREDIPDLANHFLTDYAADQGRKITGFTEKALDKLMAHDWPGNIRELSNVVQRAVIFCSAEKVDESLISFLDRPATSPDKAPRRRAPFLLEQTSEETVLAALKKNHGRVRETARELSMAWSTLYKFMRERKIRARDFQQGFGAF